MAFMNYTKQFCMWFTVGMFKWDTVKNGSCKLYFSNVHGNVSITDLCLSDFFLHLLLFMRKLRNLQLWNLPKCFGGLYLWMELWLLWPGCDWEYLGRRGNRIQGEGPICRVWLERTELLLALLWGVNSSTVTKFYSSDFAWVGKFALDFLEWENLIILKVMQLCWQLLTTQLLSLMSCSLSQCLLNSLFPLPGVL